MLLALLAVSGVVRFDTYEVSIDVKDQFLARARSRTFFEQLA